MPEYTYSCDKCNTVFSIVCSIREYKEKTMCPQCQSIDFVSRNYLEDLGSLNTSVIKNDSDLKTIGDLANRNRDKMSSDHKANLESKHNEYKEQKSTKELPSGMSRIQKPNFKYRWSK